MKLKVIILAVLSFAASCVHAEQQLRGTGDMGVIIERADGAVKIIEHSNGTILGTVEGLGDLSHASVVYSRDERYAYVFGRDGGLTKIDILRSKITHRIMQSGNSIGGAISQDGKLIAVSNYKPGGVKVFNASDLSLVADIPASYGNGQRSKTVGLVDAPGQKFVYSLYDAGSISVLDMSDPQKPQLTEFKNIGKLPYDGLISPDGRIYMAGLFGEPGLAQLDLWHLEKGVKRVLDQYGIHEDKLPVYKMPHLEGWTMAGDKAFVPGVGHHSVEVIDTQSWTAINSIKTVGQPVFVMVRPDHRQVWVNFAFPDNQYIQVIDTESMKIIKTMELGKGILHMEFTPRGEQVWISVRDKNRVDIFDTEKIELIKSLKVRKPSGIFFTDRAHRIGL
ncbi:MAG: cytochrome D1 domain-containing protein [bacterium]